MTDSYLQLRHVQFSGPKKEAELRFASGVNVICGASETGKSFLAESIDFMLGGSSLKEIPERVPYGEIALEIITNTDEAWRLTRATSGGDFLARSLADKDAEPFTLKQQHAHDRTDNLSGFLLDKIGLLGKRILRSSAKGTTQSLSFRNLARLIIVQEGEIQQTGSPFWGGQFTLKTAEIATMKLLLTDVDDSNVVAMDTSADVDNSKQIALIDELLVDLHQDIADLSSDEQELSDKLAKYTLSIDDQEQELEMVQKQLDDRLAARRKVFVERSNIEGQIVEINELLARFDLLQEHYEVDKQRLSAIQEGGSMFAHLEPVTCPLCGAAPNEQHRDEACEGDVEAIVQAATAEILKIDRLSEELTETVDELRAEAEALVAQLRVKQDEYGKIDAEIQKTISPQIGDARAAFTALIRQRSDVQKALDLFDRVKGLENRKQVLVEEDAQPSTKQSIVVGIPEAASHALSLKIGSILNAWHFPGDCHVHYDKEASDFVIDGKPRGSRGKGLRAITHAAVTIGLLEYCQEHSLSHPGFVVLDSPLLAYFKPEGPEDIDLQGTDLKEQFYNYLVRHHTEDSQIIIIENQHPPEEISGELSMTVFTRNPNEGRFGLL